MNLVEPYISKKDSDDIGYQFEINKTTEMLRFDNLNDIFWTLRKVRGTTYTTFETENEKRRN